MENEDTAPLRSYGNRSINTTWTVSYNAIRAKNEGAANLLLLWAHLDNKILPYWILQAGVNRSSALAEDLSEWLKDAADDEVKFLKVVRLLRSYCLVESLHGSSTHSTHPVVHQWAFHIQKEYHRAELSRLAVLIIGYAVPDEYATEYHQKQRQLFPHAESWMERMERTTVNTEAEVDEKMLYALHRIGMLLSDQGKLEKAEKMYQRALEGYEKAWGPDHTSTLSTVNNLGNLYANQGKLAEAEKMYQRALEGKEKAWGPDYTSTLNTVNNLGLLYADQGKLAEAEKMYQRALYGYEKALGPHNVASYVPALNTAYSYGTLFENQGRLSDAKLMYSRALRGYKIVFGTEYRWYRAAQERLQHLETCRDSRSASPMAASRLDQQAIDVSPMTGSAGLTTSKRLRLLRKLRLR